MVITVIEEGMEDVIALVIPAMVVGQGTVIVGVPTEAGITNGSLF